MRVPGWESKLAALVEKYRHVPFEWGEHDCATFASKAVKILTGVDYLEAWPKDYTDRKGMLRSLQAYTEEGTLSAGATKILNKQPTPVTKLKRGDLALHRRTGESLSVVLGDYVCFPVREGLRFASIRECLHGWRID